MQPQNNQYYGPPQPVGTATPNPLPSFEYSGAAPVRSHKGRKILLAILVILIVVVVAVVATFEIGNSPLTQATKVTEDYVQAMVA